MSKTDSGNSNSKKNELSWGPAILRRVAVILLVLLLDAKNESKYVEKCEQVNGNGEYKAEVKITITQLLDLIKKYEDNINKTINVSENKKDKNENIQFFIEGKNKKEISRYIQRMIIIDILENSSKEDKDNCQGQKEWNLILKLDSDKKNIYENIKCLCKSWNDSTKRPSNSQQIKIEEILCQSSQETVKTPPKNENTDPEKRKRKAADILRSFDCVKQESISKQKIVNDKMGIFPTTVEKELELWFRWRLTKCMGDFEKIKKITINIDFSIAHDFNQFWHKFGKYIGEKNNLNRKKVIDELVELCETQPVLIIINNVTNLYLKKQPLASSEENIFNFFYHLFNSFRSNKNKSYKSYLVVFLVEGKKKSQNINQEYSNQINNYSPKEDIIELQFTDFLQKDIESWLTENERKLGEEGFCANIEPGKMDYLLQQDSITLLDEVCQQVFNLEGILDVEHYWKNIA